MKIKIEHAWVIYKHIAKKHGIISNKGRFYKYARLNFNISNNEEIIKMYFYGRFKKKKGVFNDINVLFEALKASRKLRNKIKNILEIIPKNIFEIFIK